jgi:hypothetical protein
MTTGTHYNPDTVNICGRRILAGEHVVSVSEKVLNPFPSPTPSLESDVSKGNVCTRLQVPMPLLTLSQLGLWEADYRSSCVIFHWALYSITDLINRQWEDGESGHLGQVRKVRRERPGLFPFRVQEARATQ